MVLDWENQFGRGQWERKAAYRKINQSGLGEVFIHLGRRGLLPMGKFTQRDLALEKGNMTCRVYRNLMCTLFVSM